MISKRHLHLHRYIESIYFAYCFGSSLNSGSAVQFVRWLLGHCSASRFTPGASDSVLMAFVTQMQLEDGRNCFGRH